MSGHDRAQNRGAGPAEGRGLIVIGGGGHALVVAEAARLTAFEVVGFLDDDENAPLGRPCRSLPHPVSQPPHPPHPSHPSHPSPPPLPASVSPPADAAAAQAASSPCCRLGQLRAFSQSSADHGRDGMASRTAAWALGIGGVALRRELIDLGIPGAVTIIHPRAWISPTAQIGRGVFIGPGAIIHTRAVIDDWAIVNSGAIVEHECHIGENAHIAPGTVLGGATRVGRDTLVGIGSRTIPGICIGNRCTVGAGSVVVRDLPEGVRAMGVPARSVAPAR